MKYEKYPTKELELQNYLVNYMHVQSLLIEHSTSSSISHECRWQSLRTPNLKLSYIIHTHIHTHTQKKIFGMALT